jgi:hypothetical protein
MLPLNLPSAYFVVLYAASKTLYILRAHETGVRYLLVKDLSRKRIQPSIRREILLTGM